MKMVMCYDIENVEVALRALLCLHMAIKRKAEIGNNLRDFVVSDFMIDQILQAILGLEEGHITRAFILLVEPTDNMDTIKYMRNAQLGG
jgi:hypothetical protein